MASNYPNFRFFVPAKVSHMFRFEASLCQVCPIKTDLNFNGHDVYSTHRLTYVLPEPVVCTVLFLTTSCRSNLYN